MGVSAANFDFAYYYTKMAMKTLFSVGPGVFTDEEFERAVAEIAKPDLEGWEFFFESMNTKIYRKYKEVCRCLVTYTIHSSGGALTGMVELWWRAN